MVLRPTAPALPRKRKPGASLGNHVAVGSTLLHVCIKWGGRSPHNRRPGRLPPLQMEGLQAQVGVGDPVKDNCRIRSLSTAGPASRGPRDIFTESSQIAISDRHRIRRRIKFPEALARPSTRPQDARQTGIGFVGWGDEPSSKRRGNGSDRPVFY